MSNFFSTEKPQKKTLSPNQQDFSDINYSLTSLGEKSLLNRISSPEFENKQIFRKFEYDHEDEVHKLKKLKLELSEQVKELENNTNHEIKRIKTNTKDNFMKDYFER